MSRRRCESVSIRACGGIRTLWSGLRLRHWRLIFVLVPVMIHTIGLGSCLQEEGAEGGCWSILLVFRNPIQLLFTVSYRSFVKFFLRAAQEQSRNCVTVVIVRRSQDLSASEGQRTVSEIFLLEAKTSL